MLTYAGKAKDIKCTEQLIPEFPELLFGRQNEWSATYFDASVFTSQKNLSSSTPVKFLEAYEVPIRALLGELQLDSADALFMNTEGHFIIDSLLLYLFLSFTDPRFMLYMFDRMDDLFQTGVAVSDTTVIRLAKSRIPADILRQLSDDAGKQ